MPGIQTFSVNMKGKKPRINMKGKKIHSFNLKKQTKKNTKEINRLKKATLPIVRFYDNHEGTVSSELHTDLVTQPNNWKECFRSTDVPGTDLPRQYNLSGVKLKWACQCESSTSGNQWLQIFLVSLKPKIAQKVIHRTTRLSNMEENIDYIFANAGTSLAAQGNSLFMLNPNFYTVHYTSGVRRIGQEIMGAGEHVTNIRDSTTRGTANIKFKKIIKNDEYNENGFKGIDSNTLEPKNHLYLVMLSNAQETAEIFLTYNALFTGRCAMTN